MLDQPHKSCGVWDIWSLNFLTQSTREAILVLLGFGDNKIIIVIIRIIPQEARGPALGASVYHPVSEHLLPACLPLTLCSGGSPCLTSVSLCLAQCLVPRRLNKCVLMS